jgi:hypothetical protein
VGTIRETITEPLHFRSNAVAFFRALLSPVGWRLRAPRLALASLPLLAALAPPLAALFAALFAALGLDHRGQQPRRGQVRRDEDAAATQHPAAGSRLPEVAREPIEIRHEFATLLMLEIPAHGYEHKLTQFGECLETFIPACGKAALLACFVEVAALDQCCFAVIRFGDQIAIVVVAAPALGRVLPPMLAVLFRCALVARIAAPLFLTHALLLSLAAASFALPLPLAFPFAFALLALGGDPVRERIQTKGAQERGRKDPGPGLRNPAPRATANETTNYSIEPRAIHDAPPSRPFWM